MNGQPHPPSGDLARNTLGVLFLVGLIAASFWIMRPFMTALLWSTMIVISTWSLMLKLQRRMGGKRSLATAVMTLGLLLILIVPLGVAAGTLIQNLDTIQAWVASLQNATIPQPPGWLEDVPLVGGKAAKTWKQLADEGREGLASRAMPYAGQFVGWLGGQLGSLGGMVLQFLLIVIISGILYSNGEQAAEAVTKFAVRLAGGYGQKAAVLAAGAIRGVAMGVLVTAAAQTTVAGIGLAISSVPGAALLTSAILVLCLAQIGPMLITIPVVIWKFYSGDPLWGSVMLVFALVSGTMDNFLRPMLIRRGADLPLLLIFAGVIGGMLSAGIMGIFVGPVILAVTHTLLKDWMNHRPAGAE